MKTFYNTALCLFLVATTVSAREVVNMNFDWKFKKGDYPGAEAVKYNDSAWKDVQLPHDWSIEGPFAEENSLKPSNEHFSKWVVWVKGGGNGFMPTGIGWYRKNFKIHRNLRDKRLYLEFDGIFRNATIWLNGQLLNEWVDVEPIKNPILDNPLNVPKEDFANIVKEAKENSSDGRADMYNPGDYDTSKNWVSGYVPLMIDITDKVNKKGGNTLVVRCDTRLREGWWYEGAGIYRDVRLLATEQVHVAKWGTYVTTPEITAEAAAVKMETTVQNDSSKDASCVVETTIVSQTGKTVARTSSKAGVAAGKKQTVSQDMTVRHPTLWSIDNPFMYRALTKVKVGGKVVDEYETPFGIRTFHFDPRLGFYLNAKYYRLDGVCNHDCIAALGVAMPDRVHYEGIKFLKDAGGKFYRAAHNPRSATELDACDKYGIIIANETRYFDNTDFAKKMLREFMLHARNHPSIMMWSLGNEEEKVQGQPRGIEIAIDLFKVMKEVDPTRATSIAQNRKVNWPGGFSDMFDVLGCNWRGASDMAEDHRKYPKRAVYTSEYNYGGTTWETFARNRNIAGSSMWTGFDYRGEGGWPGVWWPGWIGDNLHYPAKNYGLAQCQWSGKATVWMNNNWSGKHGLHVKIRGYSNCDELTVYLGGQEVKKIQMPNRSKNKTLYSVRDCQFDFDLQFTDKDIKVVGTRGTEKAEQTLKPLGSPVRVLLEPSATTLKSDGEDVSIIKISLVDSNGNLIRKGDDNQQLAKEIKVDVKGAGYLLATANTAKKGSDPGVASSLAGGNPWTHDGYCQAIIRSNGKDGDVTITASTVDGSLKAGTVTVRATEDADPTRVDIAKEQPVKIEGNVNGGFIIGELSLPEKNVKADVSTSFDVRVKNVNSFYPIEITLFLDGKKATSEKFSVELGRERVLKIDGPRLYKGGKHTIKAVFSRNGREIKSVEKTLKVKETPVAFSVDTDSIPSAVFRGEKFTFSAPVRNTGSKSSSGMPVPLKIDGKKMTGPAAELQPGETQELTFKARVQTDAKAGAEYKLEVGKDTKIVKVIDPIVSVNDLNIFGAPKQVEGKENSKALSFDGKDCYIKFKKPVDLTGKLFTVCVWYKHERDGDTWSDELPILSGSGDGSFRAGANQHRDLFWSFKNRHKWRHPKADKGQWNFHTYQLQGRFLPRQTGGILQEDGNLSEVQEAKTTDMAQLLYHNEKRGNPARIEDNEFYEGDISHIGTFWGNGRFKGDIDDVKIYERSLSKDEITSLYEEGPVEFPTVRDGLVFWADFEGDDFGSVPYRKPPELIKSTVKPPSPQSSPPRGEEVKAAPEMKYPKASRVYLQIKDAASVKQGWGDPVQDKSVQSNPIRIAGLEYARGIGTHSYGEMIFKIGGKGYKRFYAMVGVDDESNGILGYEVILDGKNVFESGSMNRGDKAKKVDIDISKGKTLKLIVTLGADGKYDNDHADWADACFIK